MELLEKLFGSIDQIGQVFCLTHTPQERMGGKLMGGGTLPGLLLQGPVINNKPTLRMESSLVNF